VWRTDCPREQDALDAVASRRWPHRAGAELIEHVSACAICADIVEVAAALSGADERASAEARVPPAAIVWWKAQIRARHDAARTAARPIAVVHGLAAASVLALAGALSIALWAMLPALWSMLPSLPPAPNLTPLAVAAWKHAPLVILVLATWLVLAPVAAWLALARE
jgi:hypothetical protein